MSGKRIVEETPCEHGTYGPHGIPIQTKRGWEHGGDCPGADRRTLTEGQYVLIEKVDGEWPYVLSDNVHRILDALSDHTEGET